MDHAIVALEPFIDSTFSDFLKEWKSGEYKKYSDCPYYSELKVLIDASNIMRKYAGYERLSIKGMLESYE